MRKNNIISQSGEPEYLNAIEIEKPRLEIRGVRKSLWCSAPFIFVETLMDESHVGAAHRNTFYA